MLPAQTSPDLSPVVHYVVRKGLEPALTLKEHDRIIDLGHFELRGSRNTQQEKFTGVGILLDHCKNLTLRNGTISGYKINILLRGCSNVRLEGLKCDFSHADPIRTSVGIPINRFLNLRNVDDWTGYGAGFWLHNCVDCHLVRCSAHHAMNGAVLVTSTNCTVYDCDFSYNSGWGLALYGSSKNRLIWNHIDFCNRPWSGGWGGDAANLVLVSNSSRNVVVGNSLTHGGDGFFLADRVEGGWSEMNKKFNFADSSDDNEVWDNDGSWASANAFEATFSHGNSFGQNMANDSTYGFWLGYSSGSLVGLNKIDRNEHDGIAIEHGSNNKIISNSFDSDAEAAVHLWSLPGDRDLERPSKDNLIAHNEIDNCGVPLDLKGSTETKTVGNGTRSKIQDEGVGEAVSEYEVTPPSDVVEALKLKPRKWKSYRDSGGPTGQAWIQPGLYAPLPFVNFGSAYVNPTTYKLWFAEKPVNLQSPNWLQLEPGSNPHYFTANATLDTEALGADQVATVKFDLPHDFGIENQIANVYGARQISLKFRTGTWNCKWFGWKNLDYEDRKGWLYLLNSPPLASQRIPNLNADYSERSPVPGTVPKDHFALLATRKFNFGSGIYRFSTVSDDGIRFFVDGREVISRWNHHSAMSDFVDLALQRGEHDLRVEYCQEDGSAQLKVDWTRLKVKA